MTAPKHPRGLATRILTSGLLSEFGLDALLVAAFLLIGVTVHRLSPALVPGYAGVLLLLLCWALHRTREPRAHG